MIRQTDIDGRATMEEPGLESEETDTDSEKTSTDSEDITLEEDDDIASIFDEETTDEESDDSEEKGPIPYERFQKKVKMAEELKSRAIQAETELRVLKEAQERAANPLQHYVDSGVEDPIAQSRRDKIIVDALAQLAGSADIQDRKLVERVIQTAQKNGGNIPMQKSEDKTENAADPRVTKMLEENVRSKTEAIVKDWSPLTKKVILREIANNVDLAKDVTKDSIIEAVKKITKEYGFTKADIFTGQDNKKAGKGKPPTSGKGGTATKADNAPAKKDEKLAKMSKSELQKHLKSRLENFLEQEEGS